MTADPAVPGTFPLWRSWRHGWRHEASRDGFTASSTAGRAWHSGSITPSGASLAQRVDYAERGVPGTAGRLRRAGRAWHRGAITPSGASLAQRVDYAERGMPAQQAA
ncbi:hypothetical protein [Halorhodospira halochloris]|uniref:hypothetical protein n=1 Tax=Halorhodospira halochloris TaxID=1052 RepID=UPI001E31AC7D|nr:hypothetical protein [Halorhodospira halochloris]